MIRSMTGFAEKKFDYETFSIKISIRSLNHRYLDWNYRGVQIGELEDRLRSHCQKWVHRGRIDVHMEMSMVDQSRWDFKINEDLLTLVLNSMNESMANLNRELSISVDNLFDIPHVVELKRKNFTGAESRLIEDGFKETLLVLVKNREREGRDIKKELKIHVRNVKAGVARISKWAKSQPRLIKSKLQERLKELEVMDSDADEKFLTEASYIAQRYDLTEEVERLKSHLQHISEILSPEREGIVGKKLDFVAQELYREINTINSKAQDIHIIKECLVLKNEVESIRQQAQNLE